MASQLVNLGTSFLVGLLVARLLGPTGKGILAFVLQAPALLSVVLSLGVANALTYYVGRGEVRPGVALGNALLLVGGASLVGVPLILWFLLGSSSAVGPVRATAAALAAVMLPLMLLAACLNGIAVGLEAIGLTLRYALASSSVTLIALGAQLVITGSTSVEGAVAASAAGIAVGAAAMVIGMRAQLGQVRVDLSAIGRGVRYSSETYLGSIASYLASRQDILILGWLAGSGAVGLYSVGVSFAEILWYIPISIGTAIMAKALRYEDESALDFVARGSRIAVLATLAGAVLMVPTVPLIIHLLYGSAFDAATFAFLWLLPGVLASSASRILWYFQATRHRIYWKHAFVATGANILLNLMLVPRFGFEGAAAASSLSYALLAVMLMRLFVRDTGVAAMTMLVPTAEDARIAFRTVRGVLSPRAGRGNVGEGR